MTALVLGIAVTTPAAHGATLRAHYDVNDPTSFVGGVLQDLTGNEADLIPGAGGGGVEYHPRGEALGNVGTTGREVQGLGYSLTRSYEGVLSDLEIAQSFAEVTAVLEPRTTVLVLLAAAALRRRFPRQALRP